MRLIERAEFQISKANAIFMFNFFVRHWNEHIHESIEPLLRGYHLGLECGNLEFAAWCALTHPVMMFCCGEPLTRVGDQAVKCLQMLSRIRQEQQQESLRLFLQMVLNWRENAGNPSALCGSAFDENERVPVYLERNNLEGLSDIYLYKTILGYWFHDYRKALEYSRQMESYLEAMLGSHFIALYYFYDALIRLALYPTASPVERWRWRIRISRDKGKFKKWAKHAPMNYLHKYELIEAEWCRVSGRNDRAGECYDRAVSLARENRFLNDEVLACELTGRFYLERGRMELAEHYLKRAHRTCRKWGADTKAAQMENLYSGQLYRQTASDDAASSATGDSRETASPSLDLASILKASQSLSSEIVTERLLVKLLHVVLENAGAETGYILLPHGDAWHLEVEGQAGKNGIHNHARPLADTDRVSLAIINYVLHTGEPVVLNDASREGPFSGDRHVTAAGTRSLLCLPLLSQGKPSGILYLVNNLTAGAFTPDRIEVLRVLASQAVISLENAQLYGTLEQKVAERTSDLARTNQQLAEARDLAEEATRAKSDFLARMSHEIRTPMNAIIGLSHLAMQTELSAKQEDYITKIQASSQNLLGIINDILDFSKIEAGKLSLESIPFKLDDVVENTCNQLALKASEKGLELLFSIAPETPLRLKGDPLRLGQILLNLSSNAVKFTDRGEVVITVSTPEKDTPAPLLRFEVRDTGIGLTNDQKTRLFLAFSQGDSSTTRRFGGTGLGLAICQRLVDMMGGEIGVDSVPGRGSAFWFTARLGLADSLPSEERILPAGLNNLKVLVVDDSETARSFLTEMLERFDFSVTSAGSGEEALQLLKPPSFAGKRRFDLILLDWNMPGIDGLETGRRVKEALGSDAPKLIMVSAYGRDEIFRRSQELGFDGFLMKPVGASVLFDTIMEAFGSPARKRHGGNRAALLRPEGFDAVRGATILMAEDNELNRQVATELLEQEGFWLTSVENGRMAVDLLRSGGGKSFDLVLMDLQMPEMDGFAATQAIRELGIDKLPIVAMTADAMSGMAERCLAAGMNDFVTKPINPQEVFAALARWIPAGTRTPRPRADKPSAVAPVPRLSNIDTVEGLQRVGGNVVAYRKLLKGFVQNQGGACEAVRMALKQKDTKLAVRSAHTLKGVSGNIGAVCLHQAAAQLEAAIKDNAPSIDELTALCETILDSVVAEIKTMYSAPAEVKASDASTPLDLKAAMPLVEQLKLLLSDNDTQAQSLLEELKALAAGTDWTGPLNDIEAALELYDFDESLRLLERLSG
ncbi:MAG: response regulator [Spirochaetes bacterium]|nr:response regulator [Spirochaetota bacterium]